MDYSDPKIRQKALDHTKGVLTNQTQIAEQLRVRIQKAKGVGADNPDNQWHKEYLALVSDLQRREEYIVTYTEKMNRLEM